MTNFKTIREAIKTKITDETEKINKNAIYKYERSTFAGFPALIIVPSDNEADYATQDKDKTTFVFKLRAYYDVKKEADHESAENALEEVVDELLTIFKDRNALGIACDWVAPAPSAWMYEERGEGVYRVAEITLRCIKYT